MTRMCTGDKMVSSLAFHYDITDLLQAALFSLL